MQAVLPSIEKVNGGFELRLNGKPTILLGGEMRNSSASDARQIERVFARIEGWPINCVLMPVSWELTEPSEGSFDFSLLDKMIEQATRCGVYLVPLWFGSLKNATSCYVPAWVKTDLLRFPRAQEKPGVSSWSVCVFDDEVARCDAKAFAAVMRRIRELDALGQTVPLVQVENEPGMLNASRDHSPSAQAAFSQPVPHELIQHLHNHRANLRPELGTAWPASPRPDGGTWSEVFGRMADEVFMAWHVARFVDRVAAAARAEHPLPLFTNAWLMDGPGYQPGQYPSGGPVPQVIDVWKCAAPSIDVLAPDIYQDHFKALCAQYDRPDNPLMIPETGNTHASASRVLYAVGRHRALMFCPFAFDDIAADATHPLAQAYRLLGQMQPMLCEAIADGRTAALLEEAQTPIEQTMLGAYRFRARPSGSSPARSPPGCVLLIEESPRCFIAVGRGMVITFEPTDENMRTAELVAADTGTFTRGIWQPGHRINGDETAHGTGILLGQELSVIRFTLHAYA